MAKDTKTDAVQRSLGRLEGTVEAAKEHLETQGVEIKEIQKNLRNINETLVVIAGDLRVHMKRSDALERQNNLVEQSMIAENVKLDDRVTPLERSKDRSNYVIKITKKALAVLAGAATFAWALVQIYTKLGGP